MPSARWRHQAGCLSPRRLANWNKEASCQRQTSRIRSRPRQKRCSRAEPRSIPKSGGGVRGRGRRRKRNLGRYRGVVVAMDQLRRAKVGIATCGLGAVKPATHQNCHQLLEAALLATRYSTISAWTASRSLGWPAMKFRIHARLTASEPLGIFRRIFVSDAWQPPHPAAKASSGVTAPAGTLADAIMTAAAIRLPARRSCGLVPTDRAAPPRRVRKVTSPFPARQADPASAPVSPSSSLRLAATRWQPKRHFPARYEPPWRDR